MAAKFKGRAKITVIFLSNIFFHATVQQKNEENTGMKRTKTVSKSMTYEICSWMICKANTLITKLINQEIRDSENNAFVFVLNTDLSISYNVCYRLTPQHKHLQEPKHTIKPHTFRCKSAVNAT